MRYVRMHVQQVGTTAMTGKAEYSLEEKAVAQLCDFFKCNKTQILHALREKPLNQDYQPHFTLWATCNPL